jgi:hypothetical protein
VLIRIILMLMLTFPAFGANTTPPLGNGGLKSEHQEGLLAEARRRQQQEKVIWSCRTYGSKNTLWLVEWADKSYIKVFDERIKASFSMRGLNKRWDWGLDESDNTYNYAITLSPDMKASYYDFSTSTTGKSIPREEYFCKK